MVEQEIIRAMLESDAPIMFGWPVVPAVMGGWELTKALAPSIVDFVAGLWGGHSQSNQAAADRAQNERWREKIFNYTVEQQAAQMERDEEARQEAIRQWEAQEQQIEAQWINTVDVQSPYHAASRAMLASTMQMDVPNYEPLYSTAEGVTPRRNPYRDFTNPGPRSA